jgi:hypothetical protein
MNTSANTNQINDTTTPARQGAMTALRITLTLGIAALIAGLGAALIAGGLLAAPHSANAGCRFGGPFTSAQCDGPVQPDGNWQRCVQFWSSTRSGGGLWGGDRRCDLMGPDLHPWGFAFADPPTHIDD